MSLPFGLRTGDHEAEAVVVGVLERVARDCREWSVGGCRTVRCLERGRDAVAERRAIGGREHLHLTVWKRVAVLLQSIERGKVGDDVLDERVGHEHLILQFVAAGRHAEDPEVLTVSRPLRLRLRAHAAMTGRQLDRPPRLLA